MLRQKRERCGFLPRVALRSIAVPAPSAPGEGQEGAALCHRLHGLSLNHSGSLSPQHSPWSRCWGCECSEPRPAGTAEGGSGEQGWGRCWQRGDPEGWRGTLRLGTGRDIDLVVSGLGIVEAQCQLCLRLFYLELLVLAENPPISALCVQPHQGHGLVLVWLMGPWSPIALLQGGRTRPSPCWGTVGSIPLDRDHCPLWGHGHVGQGCGAMAELWHGHRTGHGLWKVPVPVCLPTSHCRSLLQAQMGAGRRDVSCGQSTCRHWFRFCF